DVVNGEVLTPRDDCERSSAATHGVLLKTAFDGRRAGRKEAIGDALVVAGEGEGFPLTAAQGAGLTAIGGGDAVGRCAGGQRLLSGPQRGGPEGRLRRRERHAQPA